MKKIKNLLCFVSVLAMMICVFSGCGKNEPGSSAQTESAGSQSTDGTESVGENGQESDAAAHFFDDAIFVGDSVSLGLRNYVTSCRNSGEECLGSAQFLVAGSMGYCNSRNKANSEDSVRPKYKGETVTIEEGVALAGAKKVFIMLGLNDFCVYTMDESMQNVKETVSSIKEKNPDTKIYIQSVTPIISAKEHGKFNNDSVDAFNSALRMTANECGCKYVDIAQLMKDSGGYFKDEYCSDPEADGVHMNADGSRVWVEYLTQTYCKGE